MEKVISLDLETTGLNPWKDQITLIGVYDGTDYTCLRNGADLLRLLETKYSGYDIIAHRADFDIKFLDVACGIKLNSVRTIHDTRLLAHTHTVKVPDTYIAWYEKQRMERNKLLPKGATHRKANPLSLKVLAPWFLKVEPFWENPSNHDDVEYNKKDCIYTFKLYKYFRSKMSTDEMKFYEKYQLAWARMLLDMELQGIQLNLQQLDITDDAYTSLERQLREELDSIWESAHHAYYIERKKEVEARYEEMTNKALAKAKNTDTTSQRYAHLCNAAVAKLPTKINYDSPAQMAWLLRDHLGLDITKIDNEEEESTGRAVLTQLADGRDDIKKYLAWREAQKVCTMYLPTYRELAINGTIHPQFNLAGTRTGRISSSNPNCQQIPSKLYKLFKPSDGYQFVQYDLSGIEAALIALYSGDPLLYDILRKGESVHDHNAKILFGLECDVAEVKKLHPRERQCAKNLGFATFYGAGWRRLKIVFQTAGFVISDVAAREKLENLKENYRQVFDFHREITGIFESGDVVPNILGRPINIPNAEDAYMKGFNTLIQSSASDLNMRACQLTTQAWKDQGLDARPILVIHDCILAEAREAQAPKAAKILADNMTGFKLTTPNGPIKLQVEGGVSNEWQK